MAKFLSVLILLLWAAAIAAIVLLFRRKGKRAKVACAAVLALCLALLAAYYFPRKNLLPNEAEVSYVELFSPLPGVSAAYDAEAVRSALNDAPAVRSAFATLFRGQGGSFQGPAHYFLISSEGFGASVLVLAGGPATLRLGDPNAPQVFYYPGSSALYAQLGTLLFGEAWEAASSAN